MPAKEVTLHFLIHYHETPHGVLHPGLGIPANEGQGAVGVSPEESQKIQRSGAPLLSREAERVGVVLPGEGRLQRELITAFQYT